MTTFEQKQRVRLVMCMGRNCNVNQQNEVLYQRVCEELGEPADFTCRTTVRWERANCLSHCEIGPNLVFYPEGRWYHHATMDDLDEIFARYHHEQRKVGEID